MKITRGELKKLVAEEIKQGLEEGWWEDAKRGVDKKLGTKFSHRTKSADLAREMSDAKKAVEQAELDAKNALDPDSLHYDPEKAQALKDKWHQSRKDYYDKKASAAAAQRSAERSRDQNRKPPEELDVYTPGGVDDDPWNKKHRVSNLAGSGNMGSGESIDRDELKKAVQEELAKVLQGK